MKMTQYWNTLHDWSSTDLFSYEKQMGPSNEKMESLVFTTASIVWWTDEQERILCLSFSFHNLGTTYSNPWACIILTDLLGFKSVMGSSLYITCDIFLSIIVICLPSFISSLLYPIAIVCQMNYFTD